VRLVFHDLLRQVILQRDGELIVHVNLDRNQQEPAHLENRNTVHFYTYALAPLRTIAPPVR
jgi:hypothetical protein